jgi:hypothetical protein
MNAACRAMEKLQDKLLKMFGRELDYGSALLLAVLPAARLCLCVCCIACSLHLRLHAGASHLLAVTLTAADPQANFYSWWAVM